MTVFSQPDAVERIANATLKAGDWNDGAEAACMMSALVPGAKCSQDCVTAGWPKWLVSLNITLFGASTDDCEHRNMKARKEFALEIAKAVQTPRDMDDARDRFTLSLLATSQFSALKTFQSLSRGSEPHCRALDQAIELLVRRIDGQDVSGKASEVQKALTQACQEVPRPEVYLACKVASESLGYKKRYSGVFIRLLVSKIAHHGLSQVPIEDVAAEGRKREVSVVNSAREELVMALNESPANKGFR